NHYRNPAHPRPCPRARPPAGPGRRRAHPLEEAMIFQDVWAWFTAPDAWAGTGGIWRRLGEHLAYSGLVLLVAAAIALPLGAWVGHTGKGQNLVVALTGALRALP